jgi:hypothetical protein
MKNIKNPQDQDFGGQSKQSLYLFIEIKEC